MAELRALARIQRRLENLRAKVNEYDESTSLERVKGSLRVLTDEWREYCEVEKFIKSTPEIEKIITSIDEIHFDLKMNLSNMEEERKHEENDSNLNATLSELFVKQTQFLERNTLEKECDTRLPQLNIPPFNGNYEEFPSFRDLFEASVHKNKRIPKVQKLQYLIGLLRGKAKEDVQYVGITEASYDEVWNKLQEMYDKKKLIVSALIKRFLEQPNSNQSNPSAIRRLADTSDEILRGLKITGVDAEKRDPWLIHILLNKLDQETRLAWARETSDITFPDIADFIKFLNQRCDDFEACMGSDNKQKFQKTKSTHVMQCTSRIDSCPKCAGEHRLFNCADFTAMEVEQRRGFAAEKRLCFICLLSNHNSNTCRSKHRCSKCRRKHNTLLHQDEEAHHVINAHISTTISDIKLCNNSDGDIRINHIHGNFQAILPTAKVNIYGRDGHLYQFRALIDSGSQASLISESCMQKIMVPRWQTHYTIKGFNSKDVKPRGATRINLQSQHNSDECLTINALIVSQFPTPPSTFSKFTHIELEHLCLADPDYYKSQPFDILLGADEFFNIFHEQRVRDSSGNIIAQNSIFGWVIAGRSCPVNENKVSNNHVLLDESIDKLLRKFWEIENVDEVQITSPADYQIEVFYKNTTRFENNRFTVRLPFEENTRDLADTYHIAMKRFLAMERKFGTNEYLRQEYKKTIQEYLDLGHMVPVDSVDQSEICYLPHHAVIKESSNTTKVRVVFDGSCKSSNGVSLNSKLMTGPTLQPSLWSTLIRFRHHKIALTADIEKMYRQVMISEDDRRYQRILWRSNPKEKIQVYQLTTVTFGLASSSFLAIRSLQEVANEVQEVDPRLAQLIRRDFYVDDMLTGAECEIEANILKESVTETLLKYGFPLRKWQSNSPTISEHKVKNLQIGNKDLCTQVLGLQWDPTSDTFKFNVEVSHDQLITKRKVISESSRLFDPLGWIAPFTVMMKILYQSLWFTKSDWDDPVPDEISTHYKRLRDEIYLLDNICIPRHIKYSPKVQYHCFSDASEKAYSAVIYMRTIDEYGSCHVNLVTAKTKVAPVKSISLPRLELCGAYLLMKLVKAMKLNGDVNDEYFAWTDSTIVLAWLSAHPSKWKTFVSNRCSEILDILPREKWNHVLSKENPADHATRGVSPAALLKLENWWHGPAWLKNEQNHWPISTDEVDSAKIIKEQRKGEVKMFNIQTEATIISELFRKFSSYPKILRILVYVKRYIRIMLKQASRGAITVKELKEAEQLCVKWCQSSAFQSEILQLQRTKRLSSKSTLISLNPFLDEVGILRVGGRLENADLPFEAKHPAILPQHHVFTSIIMKHVHEKYLHPGPTNTLNLIRQHYWIIHGRSAIRKELKLCLKCVKYRPITETQIMGQLPASRVTFSRPFSKCGVDYAGPIEMVNKKGRGASVIKSYVAVFVCMTTKALHLEAVTELTTDAFIATLKRFCARRGVPTDIYSDNATNFVGAWNEIRKINQFVHSTEFNNEITKYLCDEGTQWHFIPPHSPNFGGLWEAGVKSMKGHLIKACGMSRLTYEELSTLLCKIEAILNSRPLCAAIENDIKFEILTPNHFLNGTASNLMPDHNLENININRLDRWKRISSQAQHFWRKYHTEYINNLNQRSKWQQECPNITDGDIVLIRDDNMPSYKWNIGRITSTTRDSHGHVRVVKVKTATNEISRSISKI